MNGTPSAARVASLHLKTANSPRVLSFSVDPLVPHKGWFVTTVLDAVPESAIAPFLTNRPTGLHDARQLGVSIPLQATAAVDHFTFSTLMKLSDRLLRLNPDLDVEPEWVLDALEHRIVGHWDQDTNKLTLRFLVSDQGGNDPSWRI